MEQSILEEVGGRHQRFSKQQERERDSEYRPPRPLPTNEYKTSLQLLDDTIYIYINYPKMCLTEFLDLWILLEKCSDLLIQDSCEDFWHRPSNYLNRDVHLGWRLVRHWEGRPGRIRRIREETWHYWHRLYAFFWDFTELKTLKILPLSFFSQMDGDSLSFLYFMF